MTVIEAINVLENTLNDIEVKGRDNIERLLGALNVVAVLKEMSKEAVDNGRQGDTRP